jgi:heat shock protein HtpX
MVSALRKISGRSALPAPAQIREMFFDNSEKVGFDSMFATHPSIEARVEALVRYAGARDVPPSAEAETSVPSVPVGEAEADLAVGDAPPPGSAAGPWG